MNDLKQWAEAFMDQIYRRIFRVLARYDAGGWPTRDAAAPEEDG